MAQTNRKLRADLLDKLGITSQALSQRRQRLQKKVAMPTDIATYVIAHREGMRIDRYLDSETIARVNEADSRLAGKEGSADAARPAPRVRKRAGSRSTEINFGKFKVGTGALSAGHVTDAEKMANAAYPVL